MNIRTSSFKTAGERDNVLKFSITFPVTPFSFIPHDLFNSLSLSFSRCVCVFLPLNFLFKKQAHKTGQFVLTPMFSHTINRISYQFAGICA